MAGKAKKQPKEAAEGQQAAGAAGQPVHLIKPKTKKGKRFLEKRAPKLVEDAKRALFLYGTSTSQVVKDAMADLHKLKGVDSQKFTRSNPSVQPFEPGGEAALEFFSSKANCSLFCLGAHSKKRPNNLTLGRLYDFHLYDAMEFGIEQSQLIKDFKGAAGCQVGNKPCMVFVGEKFESDPQFRQAKSLLMDFFRGQQVKSINLAGLDRVIVVFGAGDTDKSLLLRQYSIAFKKSGTKVPRVALTEMGPALDLVMRRQRLPAVDTEKEALKQPKTTAKKQKNVGGTMLEGKVGRIYMPKQTFDTLGLSKMKGLKRERREAAAAAAEQQQQQQQDGSGKRSRIAEPSPGE